MDIEFIVVTEKNAWGKGKTAFEAFKNARLEEQTASSYFFQGIEDLESIADIDKEWREWAQDDHGSYSTPENKVAFVLYTFDHDVWENFRISDIDGGVSFIAKDKPVRPKEEIQADFMKCVQLGYWLNGIITPREKPKGSEDGV